MVIGKQTPCRHLTSQRGGPEPFQAVLYEEPPEDTPDIKLEHDEGFFFPRSLVLGAVRSSVFFAY